MDHGVVGDVGGVGENLGDVGENLGDVGENLGDDISGPLVWTLIVHFHLSVCPFIVQFFHSHVHIIDRGLQDIP